MKRAAARGSRGRQLVGLSLALLSLGGCASTTSPSAGEAPFAVDHCAALVPAYQQQLWQGPPARDKERLLFRLALCHAIAGTGVTDPTQAAQYFQQVAWNGRGSDLALAARAWLESHEVLSRLESERAAKDPAASDTNGCPPEHGEAGAKASSTLARTSEELQRCQEELAEREREIARIKKALDELIRLDIEKPPQPR